MEQQLRKWCAAGSKIDAKKAVREEVLLVTGVVMVLVFYYLLPLYPSPGHSSSHLSPARSWRDGPRQTDLTASLDSDVSGYDEEEVSRWYNGSACSGRAGVFVGNLPLFPPCRQDLYPGVANWGNFPYLGPFQFMNNSKNPCWEREGQVMCVPYFYLIGVSKSGTSDLFTRLGNHPQMVWQKKEFHFFDRYRYTHLTFEKYVQLFNKLASAVKVDIRRQGYSHLITGDGSPSYFYDNYNWQLYSGNENCSEPRVILANHIYHLNPAVKILMVVRHPVYRLYSRYMFDYGRKERSHLVPTKQKFHSFVVDGLRKFRECFQRWSLRHCVYNKTLMESMAYIRIQENLYPVLLEDWLRVVPRDQFLFIRFEDYKKDIATQLRRAYSFLGMKNLSDEELMNITQLDIKNEGPRVRAAGPMLPETERLLQDFYQPFIRRFSAMLNDKKFLWEDV